MSEEHIQAIKRAVSEAMQEQMKDFYIEREKHYQHHQFIGELIEWSKSWKSTAMKAIANTIVMAAIALLLAGYIAWGGKTFKP